MRQSTGGVSELYLRYLDERANWGRARSRNARTGVKTDESNVR